MPLQVTCIAGFHAAVCCRRKSAENLSVVVRRRFFLAVRRTLATTAAELEAAFRAALRAFLCARGSSASTSAVCASSTSSTSSLFWVSFLTWAAVAFADGAARANLPGRAVLFRYVAVLGPVASAYVFVSFAASAYVFLLLLFASSSLGVRPVSV
jgi:hypothetical protein